ncbi:MAG: EthD domain-containing protein [Pseudomonadales bacterium]
MYKLYCFLEALDQSEGCAAEDVFSAQGQAAAALLQSIYPTSVAHVQTRALPTQLEDALPAYAGALEVYFDSKSAALDVYRNCSMLSPLWNHKHVQLGASLLGLQRVVSRLPAHHLQPSIKGVFPFRRRADLSIADFQAHWWHRHAPIAAQTQDAVYYPQCHPLADCYEAARPPFDGVTELHWPDYDSAVAAMQSEQMQQDQANDAQNFVDTDSVILFFGVEEAVTPP